MRIIGGHDYYDSAMAYGEDPSIVFVRKVEAVEAKDFPVHLPGFYEFAHRPLHRLGGKPLTWRQVRELRDDPTYKAWTFSSRGVTYGVKFYVTVFCGKVYGSATVERVSPWNRDVPVWYHTLAALEERLANHDWQLDDTSSTVRADGKTMRWAVEQFFETRLATSMELTGLIDQRVVLAHACLTQNRQKPVWLVNGPTLTEVDFARKVPPYEAWQEISMWVGSTLPVAGRPMVQIQDDKIKAAKHGFDDWSFRKKVR